MHRTIVKTDLSCITVQSGEKGPVASFVDAAYWDGCPIPPWCEDGLTCLCPSKAPLVTHILLPPVIVPTEPGAYYRLPHVVCEAVGAAGPLAVVPVTITIEHTPYSVVEVDEHGRMYASDRIARDEADRVYSTELRRGSHVLCALFRLETAVKWAALPREAWRELHAPGFQRRYGLDPSWADPFCPGAVRIEYAEPLLNSSVEVYRETA